MTLTKELMLAIAQGMSALRDSATDLENEPETKLDNGAGRNLRLIVERKRQDADLLAGWLKRTAADAGVDPNTLDI